MSENDNNQNNPYNLNGRNPEEKPFEKESSVDAIKEHREEKKLEKFVYIKKVRELSKGEWLLTQELFQEVEAAFLTKYPEKKLTNPKGIELVTKEIQERYQDDEEVRDILLQSIPSIPRIHQWRKMDGWKEAVWSKIRNCNMFNNENRFKVIDSLYKKAVDGDVTAAKIWLTLSGDYSDKMDINSDKKLEAYREINEIIHKKKEDQ